MERYSEYKDSGVKWLGEIPSHWNCIRLKNVFSKRTTGSWGEEENHSQKNAECLRIADFDYNKLRFQKKEEYTIRSYASKEVENKKLVKGDLLIEKSGGGDKTPVGRCVVFDLDIHDAMYANFMEKLSPRNDIDSFYICYLLSCFYSYGMVWPYVKATTGIQNLDITSLLSKEYVYIPPRAEQDAIVRYLDAATSKIDKAIAMQQKMIDLLNERKQIIIQNAVTKGLDENVEMKDSGVEWIGMIPKHWKIIRIKHLAKLQSGSNLTSNEISDTGSYPVYGGNGLRGFYGSYNCEGSYVLIGRQGALCGNINYAEDKFWATEHAVVCYPKKKYNTLWFGEVLRLMDLGQYSLASAQPGLAVERIKGLYMPYPSIEEQNKIALFLKQNIGKIDLYARHCQRQITLLQERKQIIINEVVTGKVKVS